MKSYLLAFGTIVSGFSAFLAEDDTATIEHNYGDAVSNSCIGKDDGDYWLLLSDDASSSPVKLTCSNEYVMLDVDKDSSLKTYFSSFDDWHYALAGPKNSDPVNWENWFLPNNDNSEASYLISPDCSSCDVSHQRQVHSTDTAYYMSGNLAKLMWGVLGFNECDMDFDTYACFDCTACLDVGVAVCSSTQFEETATDYTTAGICGTAVGEAKSDDYIKTERKLAASQITMKPSLGTDGRFCVCYQPSDELAEEYTLTDEQEQIIEDETASESESSKTEGETKKMTHVRENTHKLVNVESVDLRETNVIHLTQDNFDRGTFRIVSSGTYIIDEDITFDFNADADYWPQADQYEMYMGASCHTNSGKSCRDPYHMGFFAGITVEADYVTIDLNEHELKMSEKFYYQQRWFATIEFSNQQFLPGQGPAFFGGTAITIQDVTVKNGILGLTSHFAIHGNYAENIVIEDVVIKEFGTHGMQLNGWENLVMTNVEVGPSSEIEYLRGDYGHGRLLSQRLRWIEEDLDSQGTINDDSNTFQFVNRDEASTISDIVDEMELQMEMALDYAMNRVAGGLYEENDYVNPKYTQDTEGEERWVKAKAQFVQESGLPPASSITGIFLNFKGASVFTYAKLTTRKSSTAKLTNIYIHDIKHEMYESVRLTKTGIYGQVHSTPWLSDLPAEHMFGNVETVVSLRNLVTSNNYAGASDEELAELATYQYVGSVLTDGYIFLQAISDDWDYLGALIVTRPDVGDNVLTEFAEGVDLTKKAWDWRFNCNQDIMFHSGKGLIGLRLDGVSDLELDNIRIENLESRSPLGTLACGEYAEADAVNGGEGGHFKQQQPMQTGFSGNNIQGISIVSSDSVTLGDVSMKNFESQYGEGGGISLWTAVDVTVKEDALIKMSNIQTGSKITEDDNLHYKSLPNRAAYACGFRLETDSSSSTGSTLYDSTLTFESNDDKLNVAVCNVIGKESCLGQIDEDQRTMYGSYFGDDDDTCSNLESTDDLKELLVSIAEPNNMKMKMKSHIHNDNSETNVLGNFVRNDFVLGIMCVAAILLLCVGYKYGFGNHSFDKQKLMASVHNQENYNTI